MKRSCKILISFIFVLFSLTAFSQDRPATLKEKILNERIEKEKGEVSLAMKVSEAELEVIKTMSFNQLLKYRKLDFLQRSSNIMKSNCLFFDSECKKVYNMSIVYLKNEMRLVKKELDEFEKLMEESHKRLSDLKEKFALLEKGVEVEISEIRIKPAIPELKNGYKCVNTPSWNSMRGIFVTPSEINDLPFQGFIKDVVKLDSGGYVIMVEAGEFTINFSYVKTPSVKAGEIVKMGRKLFTGSAGNPVMPGNILIFITKNGKFVNPVFMCK
ncbi:MAG TPA: hypothetical protein VLJ60_06180 [bacterium]|nr:hypothetical protein [bacterium]